MQQNTKIYITHIPTIVSDGGSSRNLAFFNYFSHKRWLVLNVFNRNPLKRLVFMIRTIFMLFFFKNKTIFIHQGTFFYLLPKNFLKKKIVFNFFYKLIDKTSQKNTLFLEVNDLPYEQSIDLELPIDKFYLRFEEKFYSIKKIHYIFASTEMEKFIKAKQSLPLTDTIINGGRKLVDRELSHFECLYSKKIKFVYAGTLNKGRQIKALLEIFKGKDHVSLILLGIEGEWINKEYKLKNVYYLGNFVEELAHCIVSKCDIGIIPYDASRFYYNLCYPTKASFYLTAGIPFLSTPLDELKNHFGNASMIYFKEISKWKDFLDNITKERLAEDKERIEEIKDFYSWYYLIDEKLNITQ